LQIWTLRGWNFKTYCSHRAILAVVEVIKCTFPHLAVNQVANVTLSASAELVKCASGATNQCVFVTPWFTLWHSLLPSLSCVPAQTRYSLHVTINLSQDALTEQRRATSSRSLFMELCGGGACLYFGFHIYRERMSFSLASLARLLFKHSRCALCFTLCPTPSHMHVQPYCSLSPAVSQLWRWRCCKVDKEIHAVSSACATLVSKSHLL
jgi:hypothetical protein